MNNYVFKYMAWSTTTHKFYNAPLLGTQSFREARELAAQMRTEMKATTVVMLYTLNGHSLVKQQTAAYFYI